MNDSVFNDYQNRWCKTGSSAYYSMLHLSEQQRSDQIYLHVFFNELLNIVTNYRDFDVALTRLQWWQDDIEMLENGTAKHPINQKLNSLISLHQLPHSNFINIGDAITLFLHSGVVKTWDDFTDFAASTFGQLLLLKLKCLNNKIDTALYQDLSRHLSAALLAVQLLRQLGQDLNRHFFYFPNMLLNATESNIKIEQSQQASPNADEFDINYCRAQLKDLKIFTAFCSNIQLFVSESLSQSSIQIEKLYQSKQLSKASRLHCIKLANLATALLKELTLNSSLILQQKISLTPLRKLWISWSKKITKLP